MFSRFFKKDEAFYDLLEARSIGMNLTESGAMTPTAAVAGLYFAHPRSRYSTVGTVGRDQLRDYARRTESPLTAPERSPLPLVRSAARAPTPTPR